MGVIFRGKSCDQLKESNLTLGNENVIFWLLSYPFLKKCHELQRNLGEQLSHVSFDPGFEVHNIAPSACLSTNSNNGNFVILTLRMEKGSEAIMNRHANDYDDDDIVDYNDPA